MTRRRSQWRDAELQTRKRQVRSLHGVLIDRHMVFVADSVKALRCERSHAGSIPAGHPFQLSNTRSALALSRCGRVCCVATFSRCTAHVARSTTTNRRPRILTIGGLAMQPHDNAKRRISTDPSTSHPHDPAQDQRPEHRRFWYSAAGSHSPVTNSDTSKSSKPSVDPNEVRR